MKRIVLAVMLLVAQKAFAVTQGDSYDGAIIKPGYDYKAPNYVYWNGDSRVAQQAERYQASYVAINDEVPDQMIIVAPKNGNTGTTAIEDNNAEDAARNFLSSVGLLPKNFELELISKRFVMGKTWFVRFAKVMNSSKILDAGIGMAISPAGKVNLLWGNFDMEMPEISAPLLSSEAAINAAGQDIPGLIAGNEYQGQAIMPIYLAEGVVYKTVQKVIVLVDDPYGVWETYIDASSGEIIQRTNKIYYDVVSGTISGSIQPLFPYEPWQERNFYHHNINFGSNVATTGMDGSYSIDLPGSSPYTVNVFLRGPFMEVWNSSGGEANIIDTVDPPATFDANWNDSNSLPAERDGWYSAVLIHNWIKTLDPGLVEMDFPMDCNVYVNGTCNAYWSGWDMSMNFFSAGGGCNNTAQIADVVYHEYGHGITDLQTRPTEPNGAMHEGFSDYIACTVTDQPLVGKGFYSNDPNGYLRTLDNNRRYPLNWNGEPHNDGLIIGGALWHTREDLSPEQLGYTDSLWHFARYALTEDFEPYLWAFLALDDNDGNLDNGTPNAWTIFNNFGDRHGIGPGTVVTVTADTLFDSEDTTRSYSITAEISTIFNPNPDSILLYYNNGAGYQGLEMNQNGSQWTATIPPQRNNTTVQYYILAVDVAGFRGTWPEGAPQNHYSFLVGPDRIPPTITLIEGPQNTINVFGPYGPFIMRAFDINGINSSQARLHYYVNNESETVVPLIPGGVDNEFLLQSLNLGRQLRTGDVINYYFTAVDDANEPNTGRLPLTGTFSCSMVTSEVFETFEINGLNEWSYDSGWILRNDGYFSSHSIWYSSPNYPNNANAPITANRIFDLSPYSSGRVGLWVRGAIRSNDSCLVELSNNNGQSWFKAGAITGEVISGYQFREFNFSQILNPNLHQYRFRLRFVSDGDSTWVGLVIDNISWTVEPIVGIAEAGQFPGQFSLDQNYPNPFNPETNISFTLPGASQVRLEVFDILGRKISTLLDEKLNAGSYIANWKGVDETGSPVSSGVYFYRVTTEQGIRQEKMTLLR